MLAVAAASMVAKAQPPPNPTHAPSPKPLSAAVSSQAVPMVKKESAQITTSVVVTPLTTIGKPVIKPKYERVDGMSSRPWAQIVGIHPGYSAFPPPEMHEPRMYLFWIGRDPYSH